MSQVADAMPRVTVIVPTYKSWDALALCLAALGRQTYPDERFEIVVVNNDPDEDPPPDLPMPANARLLTEAKKGSYAARNAGIREAEGDILLFTDADCIPEPEWCAAAVATLVSRPGTARVGGEIKVGVDDQPTTVAEVYETLYAFPQSRYISEGWFPTANMGAWKAVVNAVGLFDSRLFSGEDKGWGLRAQTAGFPIAYASAAVVRHPPRGPGDILVKRRRIGGADMARRIAATGRAMQVPGYILRLIRRLLPPTRAAGLLFRLRGVPPGLRLRTFFFIWLMRIDMELARGRVLILGHEPERR